jgi:glycosyl transferase family 25
MSSLPIVFINLSKDAERRERMTAQFAQMGLTASRLPAVWWADLSEQKHYFCAPQSHGRYFKPLSNGEKGCYASHLRSWQQLWIAMRLPWWSSRMMCGFCRICPRRWRR